MRSSDGARLCTFLVGCLIWFVGLGVKGSLPPSGRAIGVVLHCTGRSAWRYLPLGLPAGVGVAGLVGDGAPVPRGTTGASRLAAERGATNSH